RRANQGFACGGNGIYQVMIGEICRSYFISWQTIVLECLQTGLIPGGAKWNQTFFPTVVESLEQFVILQLESAQDIQRILCTQICTGIVAAGCILIQGVEITHL